MSHGVTGFMDHSGDGVGKPPNFQIDQTDNRKELRLKVKSKKSG